MGSAYVLKQSAGEELLLAVRMVNEGPSYLSPLLAKETIHVPSEPGTELS